MAQFIAAAKENLAAGSAQQLGKTLIHGDAKIASRVAAMRDLILLQDGTKGHPSFQHEVLCGLGQEIEMDADGTKFDGLAIAATMQHGGADEVVADARTGCDFEVDVTAVKITQMRCHVAIMHQQVSLLIREFGGLDKGDAWSSVTDPIKENQRSQNVFILTWSVIHRGGHASEWRGSKTDWIR